MWCIFRVIIISLIYKSENLTEISQDNSFYETYDDQGLGIKDKACMNMVHTLLRWIRILKEYVLLASKFYSPRDVTMALFNK